MDQARLKTLEADIERQMELISSVYSKVRDRRRGFESDVARLESLALQVHNLYCAFEDLAKLVADAFENRVGDRERWHERLMARMTVEIKGVRPRLFSEKSRGFLQELRGFRHVVRHSYGRDIDVEKMRMLLKNAEQLEDVYESDVRTFLSKLRRRK